MDPVEIPHRPVFRPQEVCELAGVQPYVLRTWEAEFPDLGVAKSANGPRLYRRADVERVLLIKQLLFAEGLTLAGARRRMTEQGLLPDANGEASIDADVTSLADATLRQELQRVRRDLHWMLEVLSAGATGTVGNQDPGSRRAASPSVKLGRAKSAVEPARSSKHGKATSSRGKK